MKKLLTFACAALLAFGLAVQDAEAKRLGGGMSRGMQRDTITQRQAAPQPAAPVPQAAPQRTPYPQQPVPQPQRRSWLGPLAGLAAGLGLGALFAHFGLGEGMGNFLMILLLVMAAVFVFKLIFRRSQPPASQEPLHYAGVGGPNLAPQERRFDSQPLAGGAPAQDAVPFHRNIPPGFDVDGFARVAKVNFIRMQAANDACNLEDLREFTTPEMYAEIKVDIDERRGAPQQTDVVTLDAEILEVVSEPTRHIASVRFHGLIREEKDGAAQPFDEVWNLVKPADGGRGWLVAGIQQLN